MRHYLRGGRRAEAYQHPGAYFLVKELISSQKWGRLPQELTFSFSTLAYSGHRSEMMQSDCVCFQEYNHGVLTSDNPYRDTEPSITLTASIATTDIP